jgi:hypothetical protein
MRLFRALSPQNGQAIETRVSTDILSGHPHAVGWFRWRF